jgi:hypothetical protein
MNDQRIGAFLDRELDDAARAAQAREIEEDAGGAMRLRVFKKADELLRQAVPLAATPSDHALSQRILNAEAISRPVRFRVARGFVPLAAACLIGVLGGAEMSRDSSLAPLRLNRALVGALDAAPSGETRTLAAGKISIAMTVRMDSGTFCRQFRLSTPAEATNAVACRDGGAWRLVAAANAPGPVEQNYHTAAGASAPLDDTLGAIGDATLVDADEERALIEGGWLAPE